VFEYWDVDILFFTVTESITGRETSRKTTTGVLGAGNVRIGGKRKGEREGCIVVSTPSLYIPPWHERLDEMDEMIWLAQ